MVITLKLISKTGFSLLYVVSVEPRKLQILFLSFNVKVFSTCVEILGLQHTNNVNTLEPLQHN
jgi:hypothetical protein